VPGLYDAPRSRKPSKVTPAYQDKWLESVWLRPRALGLDFSLWTLARLSDYLAEANWGEKTIEELAQHLKTHHPERKGFNRRGL
jgi:hypothetical protein